MHLHSIRCKGIEMILESVIILARLLSLIKATVKKGIEKTTIVKAMFTLGRTLTPIVIKAIL
jgi:hypothetical protein